MNTFKSALGGLFWYIGGITVTKDGWFKLAALVCCLVGGLILGGLAADADRND